MEGQLLGGLGGQLPQLTLGLTQDPLTAVLGLCLGVGYDLTGLLPGLSQLVLSGLLDGLLGLCPLLTNFLVGLVQLVLALRLDPLRLRQLGGGGLIQAAVVGLALGHKLLDRLVEEKIQPAGKNGQIQPVQQNLLPVNIQGHFFHLPYNTKIIRITTSRA